MNYHELLTIITLFFLFLASFSLATYRKKYQNTKKELDNMLVENSFLVEEYNQLKKKVSEQVSFARDLTNAELTTKLQHSRTHYQSNGSASAAPERYNYVKALSDSGIEPAKIAELLSISSHEAEQLVKLSEIGSR